VPAPSSIAVTIEGDPTQITLRPEVVAILKTFATTENLSEELARWLVDRINVELSRRLKTDIDVEGGPIKPGDIHP
jgi:hypothetical protein